MLFTKCLSVCLPGWCAILLLKANALGQVTFRYRLMYSPTDYASPFLVVVLLCYSRTVYPGMFLSGGLGDGGGV